MAGHDSSSLARLATEQAEGQPLDGQASVQVALEQEDPLEQLEADALQALWLFIPGRNERYSAISGLTVIAP